jgi:hypothetical protein
MIAMDNTDELAQAAELLSTHAAKIKLQEALNCAYATPCLSLNNIAYILNCAIDTKEHIDIISDIKILITEKTISKEIIVSQGYWHILNDFFNHLWLKKNTDNITENILSLINSCLVETQKYWKKKSALQNKNQPTHLTDHYFSAELLSPDSSTISLQIQ